MSRKGAKFTIILLVITALMLATNPDEKKHKMAIISEVIEKVRERAGSSESRWDQLGVSIAEKLAGKILQDSLTRENFYLFSMGKLDYNGKQKFLTLGCFGTVFVLAYPDILEQMN